MNPKPQKPNKKHPVREAWANQLLLRATLGQPLFLPTNMSVAIICKKGWDKQQ